MKTWITSDLHFGHTNIIKFCPKTRGIFDTAAQMNEQFIARWNDTVASDDTVFILGDVAFMNATDATALLSQLKGKKILIKGNHDRKLLEHDGFRACFAEVHSDWVGSINGTYIHMYHFPLREWDRMHRGAVHFHGHVHGNETGLEKYRCRDAGYDATGKVVTLIDDLIADAVKGEIRNHH